MMSDRGGGVAGQRKVLFTCLKRNLFNKEIKVAQLAGSVAEMSAYHHGEVGKCGHTGVVLLLCTTGSFCILMSSILSFR